MDNEACHRLPFSSVQATLTNIRELSGFSNYHKIHSNMKVGGEVILSYLNYL